MPGSILINGNIRSEVELIGMARERLLSSHHQDPEVRESRKVLLVTAGWKEREYQEGHVKEALLNIGVPSRRRGGFEVNLQNLSLFHSYQEFLDTVPSLAERWHLREEQLESARSMYLERNSFYTALLRQALSQLKAQFPERRLSDVVDRPYSHPPARFDGPALLGYFLGLEIQDTVRQLQENDDRMVELLGVLDRQFVTGTGLHFHPIWQRLRTDLCDRILSANSIFLFGGDLAVLHRCMLFFRLREVLAEALRRGTRFYTVSAGSLVLCERIIIYNDFASELGPRREFQLFDRGFGLVRHLQIFPHCMDRIQTDDPDNLAYLAHRFRNRTCVGLNEDSFLLLETEPELHCTSVGRRDGVYVFDDCGSKVCYDYGRQIPLG